MAKQRDSVKMMMERMVEADEKRLSLERKTQALQGAGGEDPSQVGASKESQEEKAKKERDTLLQKKYDELVWGLLKIATELEKTKSTVEQLELQLLLKRDANSVDGILALNTSIDKAKATFDELSAAIEVGTGQERFADFPFKCEEDVM